MIKLEKVDVHGWEAAVRGMRNPHNSWDKSDSSFSCVKCDGCHYENEKTVEHPDERTTDIWCNHTCLKLGENDLKLMKNLSKAGNDHAKFLRMINVTVDITAPLYWWKEFETYKVATVSNGCSTMHKLITEPFTREDFSFDDELLDLFACRWFILKGEKEETALTPSEDDADNMYGLHLLQGVINDCEALRQQYLKTKDVRYWRMLIQILPSSYNQKRTIQLNYQVLKSMYFARKNHKLKEWREFCKWCESLPYFREIVIQE